MNDLDTRMTDFEDNAAKKWYTGTNADGEVKIFQLGNNSWLGTSLANTAGPFDTESQAQDSMTQDAGDAGMLTGKDYPELCNKCRSAIDACFAMIGEMPEDWCDDDNELPCNMAYDLRMFCGKRECVNEPGQTQDAHRRNPGFCGKCGGACQFDSDGQTQEIIPIAFQEDW